MESLNPEVMPGWIVERMPGRGNYVDEGDIHSYPWIRGQRASGNPQLTGKLVANGLQQGSPVMEPFPNSGPRQAQAERNNVYWRPAPDEGVVYPAVLPRSYPYYRPALPTVSAWGDALRNAFPNQSPGAEYAEAIAREFPGRSGGTNLAEALRESDGFCHSCQTGLET